MTCTLRIAAVAAALALTACDGEASLDAIAPCRCEVEACSSDACEVEVVLDASCAEAVPAAEILIDDHVERELVQPGGSILACTRVEPGASARVHARGGAWAWGPEDVTCALPGGARLTLTLRCDTPPARVEDR